MSRSSPDIKVIFNNVSFVMIVNLVDIWRRMDVLKSSPTPRKEIKNFKAQGVTEFEKNMRNVNIIKESEQ